MTLFFTSDTHFGHANIIRLSNRPFGAVEDMNERIVENWNRVVGADDVVYHLGDAVMGKFEDNVSYLGRLNGKKFLVPGNHDRVFSQEKPARRERFRAFYEENGFEVVEEMTYGVIGGHRFILCHFPFEGDSHDGDRFENLRPARGLGMPVVHGHVHEKWRINGDQFNVGVDVNDFTPVHEDVIEAWLNTL